MRSAQRGSDPAAALALAAGEPFYANLFTGYAVQHSETVYFDRLRSNQEDSVDTDTKSSRSVPETARDTSPLEVILVLFLLFVGFHFAAHVFNVAPSAEEVVPSKVTENIALHGSSD
jgi:hypothetical protein